MGMLFVLSVPRSGSTLLWKLLAAHSQIGASRTEIHLLVPLLSPLNPQHRFLAPFPFARTSAHARQFVGELPDQNADYYAELERMTVALHRRACGEHRYYLDKTPTYAFVVEQLLDAFPTHHFIFLFRNPLAIAASMARSFRGGRFRRMHRRLQPQLHTGILALERAFRTHRENPRVLRLSYEDLVSDAAGKMKEVSRFLDLDYEPQVLDSWAERSVTGPGDRAGERKYQTISTNSLDAWPAFFSTPTRVRWAHKYLAYLGDDALASMGYSRGEIDAQIPAAGLPNRLFLRDLKHHFLDFVDDYRRRLGAKLIRQGGGLLPQKKSPPR